MYKKKPICEKMIINSITKDKNVNFRVYFKYKLYFIQIVANMQIRPNTNAECFEIHTYVITRKRGARNVIRVIFQDFLSWRNCEY